MTLNKQQVLQLLIYITFCPNFPTVYVVNEIYLEHVFKFIMVHCYY